MYLDFFKLSQNPFNMTPDTRFLFLSRQYEEALQALLYGIHQRKGFVVLTGEVGTGKTTICRELLNRLGDTVASSLILNPLLTEVELIQSINRDFGCATAATLKDNIEILNEFLIGLSRANRNAVVIMDEAQHFSFEALELIRMLSNLETEKDKLLQIILVGQPELDEKLKSYSLRQLNQRIGVRYAFQSLNLDETESYIFHRLFMANANGKVHFKRDAVKQIYRHSKGVPRLINMTCDRALLAAYVKGSQVVDQKIAKIAIQDVGIAMPKEARLKRWMGWFKL